MGRSSTARASSRKAKAPPKKKAASRPRLAGPGDSHVVEVRLSAIRLDGGTQPRRAMDQAVVEEYAASMRAGAVFPPPVVFGGVRSESYYLADGFHRVSALQLLERETILADLREGTRRDAVLYSVGANASHGLRRTREDARRAVATLLRDEEWGRRSDRWIAEQTHVSDKTVARVRAELGAGAEIPQLREGRDGKAYSAPARSARPTTTVLDGDPGPDEEEYTSPEQTSLHIDEETADDEGSALDAADRALERVRRHAEAGTLAPAPRSGRLPPGDGAGFDEAGPVSLVKPPTWRDVLGLGPGAVTAQAILDAADRARSARAAASGGVLARADEERIDRAVAVGLSKWFTREREADLMAEMLLRLCPRPLRILEPSAGDGALVRALRKVAPDARITACEVDPAHADVLSAIADEVVIGDFFGTALGAFDAVISNPPYEGGLDGRFLEESMSSAPVVVALLRLNALTGKDRCERVWSLVDTVRWALAELLILERRPGFDGPGEHGAQSDYVIVGLVANPSADARLTRVRWA